MSKKQLHEFAAKDDDVAEPVEGVTEHTPVKFLKLQGMSLESAEAQKHAGKGKKFEEADYVSQRRNDPFKGRDDSLPKFYRDHGCGNHHEETETYHSQD